MSLDDDRIRAILSDPRLIDDLAALEHQRWAHWQSYLHRQCIRGADGSLTIPAELVARWEKQTALSYSDLSDEEQDSDREQVGQYLPIIVDAILGDSI